MFTSWGRVVSVFVLLVSGSGFAWAAGPGAGGARAAGGGGAQIGGGKISVPGHNFSAPGHSNPGPVISGQRVPTQNFVAPGRIQEIQRSAGTGVPTQNFVAPGRIQEIQRSAGTGVPTQNFVAPGRIQEIQRSAGTGVPTQGIQGFQHQAIINGIGTNGNHTQPFHSGGYNPVIQHKSSPQNAVSHNFVQRNFNNIQPLVAHAHVGHTVSNVNLNNNNNNNNNNWNNHWNNGGGSNVQPHHHGYWNNNSFFFGFGSPFGFGYGSGLSGYGNYGFGGYGLGGYGGYGYPYYGYGSSLYGNSRFCYGTSSYGYPTYSYLPTTTYYGVPTYTVGTSGMVTNPILTAPAAPTAPLASDPTTPTTDLTALDYAGHGEQDFKAGNYKSAVKNWRHALVDTPNNAAYVLLLGQALFAAGDFDEAAGATQQAAQMLPPEHWNVVIKNYKELYTSIGDYSTQLRVLEKARNEKPDSPALRFLLGWHYGFLGYPKESVAQLDKLLELAPTDEIGKKLRDQMVAKMPKDDALPAAPVEEGKKI